MERDLTILFPDEPKVMREPALAAAQPQGRTNLARRLKWARLDAASGRASTIVLCVFFVVQATAIGWISQKWMIPATAWIAVLGIGAALVGVKIYLDARDEPIEETELRQLLLAHVGTIGRSDPAMAALLDTAVDCRVRLESGHEVAAGSNAATAAALMLRIDSWFDRVCDLAGRLEGLRARSEASNMRQAEQRLRIKTLQDRAGRADDPLLDAQIRRTVEGITAQIEAADDLASMAERGYLRFESSVAELDAVTSKFALMLSRGEDLADASGLDEGIRTACDQIDGYLRAADRIENPAYTGGKSMSLMMFPA